MDRYLCLIACAPLLAGCDAPASISGSVMGSEISSSAGFSVHRLADTQLSAGAQTLDLYFGDGILSGQCPDILLPSDGHTTLVFGLRGAEIGVGSYPVCSGFDCPDKHTEFRLFDGWQLVSGESVEPESGSTEITAFGDGRVAGSFSLDFAGELVTGEFDIDVECTDTRPGV